MDATSRWAVEPVPYSSCFSRPGAEPTCLRPGLQVLYIVTAVVLATLVLTLWLAMLLKRGDDASGVWIKRWAASRHPCCAPAAAQPALPTAGCLHQPHPSMLGTAHVSAGSAQLRQGAIRMPARHLRTASPLPWSQAHSRGAVCGSGGVQVRGRPRPGRHTWRPAGIA